MKIRRIDHVGIIVEDLAAAKAFFLELGLNVLGEAHTNNPGFGHYFTLESPVYSYVAPF
ncbi:VOC family protein [Fictibacillus sp. NRS-1165]|uniref:VOC family protein n=1 Tax=Fictibacillus sp. NRS-1165 TaxID=3144463 RepID=UPI003D1D5F00